jgi:phosphatidylinositol alpha-1,6-mannosyltransferase
VEHEVTGLVVNDPNDMAAVAEAYRSLLDDPQRRAEMARASRVRAETEFAYDVLAARLGGVLHVADPGDSVGRLAGA